MLYCGAEVIRHLLTFIKGLTGEKEVETNRKLLLEIAEDHEEPELVREILLELVDQD